MSAEKRPAADSFGSSQLVKRARSDANLNDGSAVAIASGTGKNGALIHAVCLSLYLVLWSYKLSICAYAKCFIRSTGQVLFKPPLWN